MNLDGVTEDDIVIADKLSRKSLPRMKYERLQFSHALICPEICRGISMTYRQRIQTVGGGSKLRARSGR